MPLLAFDYLTVSVTVSSVRYTKHCVDGQPGEHFLWHTLVKCCLADRLWQRCRNQNILAPLLMPSDITVCGTVLVDVVLIVHVSRTTKITVTVFIIISTYPPGGRIGRRDRPHYSRFAL